MNDITRSGTAQRFNVRRRGGVQATVDGRVYEADSYFNLRNLLLDQRNSFNEAAREVEAAMAREDDPMLAHVSRIARMP